MKRRENITTSRLITVSLGIWAIISCLATLSAGLYWISADRPPHWAHLFWYKYTYGIVWSLFLPLLVWIIKKWPFEKLSWQKLLGVHSIWAIVLASSHRFLAATLNHFIQSRLHLFNRPYGWWEYVGGNFWGNALEGITTYAILIPLLYGYFLYWRNLQNQLERSQLVADLSKAELKNLESQLQPHFLFNTMQSIAALMHKDVEAADTGISELSDLLRMSFKRGEQATILLMDELAFCHKYIALQQLRFQHNLSITIACPDHLKLAFVPTMILQPFLENSIKHGFEPADKKGIIEVAISQQARDLVLEIKDNGVHQKRAIQLGTGFNNTLSRLQFLYQNNFGLDYHALPTEGFRVRIKIPFRYKGRKIEGLKKTNKG